MDWKHLMFKHRLCCLLCHRLTKKNAKKYKKDGSVLGAATRDNILDADQSKPRSREELGVLC